MSSVKHTPGPWSIKFNLNVVAGKRVVANAGAYRSSVNPELVNAENRANARLIAAAPEMYAKLDKIADWLERCAKDQERFADSCRFESLVEASRQEAKNFRATASDIRKLMEKATGGK